MKILAVDSSGMAASAAVLEDDVLRAEYTVHYRRTHSQTLLPMLDEIRSALELDLNSLDAVAVAGGPGSFTGLRIGSATVKGIGLALDKPLISVPTLEGMAYNFFGSDRIVVPMLDARRGQVFAAAYAFREDAEDPLEVLMQQTPVDVRELCAALDGMAKKSGKKLLLMGDGAVSCRAALEEHLTSEHMYAPAHLNEQKAGSVAARGMDMIRSSSGAKLETAAAHRPVYLRVSQAERVRAEKMHEGN